MLGTAAAVKTIAKFVSRQKFQHVVLDPVLRSSSGASLLDAAGTETLVRRLLRSATMATPNTEEASVLTGLAVTNVSSMKKAAVKLHEMGASAMVITGGALNPSTDLLSISRGADLHQKVFRSRHLKSNSTHGTGCAFSTALACNLASGKGLEEAVRNAKAFVRQAIKYGHVIGHGTGPVNPLFVLNTSRSALTKRRR
jgi:hydroxymethylpyrimidine/phosphomethylpyrimidine kinase